MASESRDEPGAGLHHGQKVVGPASNLSPSRSNMQVGLGGFYRPLEVNPILGRRRY